MSSGQRLVEIDGVSKRYAIGDGGVVTALEDVRLGIDSGTVTAVMGRRARASRRCCT